MIVFYNHRIKSKPVILEIPGNVLRKIIGGKRYRTQRDEFKLKNWFKH